METTNKPGLEVINLGAIIATEDPERVEESVARGDNIEQMRGYALEIHRFFAATLRGFGTTDLGEFMLTAFRMSGGGCDARIMTMLLDDLMVWKLIEVDIPNKTITWIGA